MFMKPGFAGLLFSISLGRLAAGLIPFGLSAVYLQNEQFLSAGIASVCFMTLASFTAPWRGRIIDRYSPNVTLPTMAVAATVLIIVASLLFDNFTGSYWGVFFVLLASLVAPLNSVVLRSVWSIVAKNEAERKSLHTLDSTLEESMFVFTPLLVALIWSTIGPQWAVALGGVAIAMSTASMFFFAYRAGSDVIAVFERKSVAPETEEASKGSIVMSAAGLALTMPMFGFALVIGFCNISFAAWSSSHVTVSFIGVLAAVTSLAGVAGGLLYGKANVSENVSRLAYLMMPAVIGAVTAVMAFVVTATGAIVVAFIIGIAMTPIFIAAFVSVPALFKANRFNEANASIGAAFNIGSGCGSLLAGLVLEYASLGSSFFIIALISFLAAAFSFVFSRNKTASLAENEKLA